MDTRDVARALEALLRLTPVDRQRAFELANHLGEERGTFRDEADEQAPSLEYEMLAVFNELGPETQRAIYDHVVRMVDLMCPLESEEVTLVTTTPTKYKPTDHIANLGLYTATYNALCFGAGVKTIAELTTKSEGWLLSLPGIGQGRITEIKNALRRVGYHLGSSINPDDGLTLDIDEAAIDDLTDDSLSQKAFDQIIKGLDDDPLQGNGLH